MKLKFSIIVLLLIFAFSSHARKGGVGINTANPKNTLHVAGTFRTDSAMAVKTTKRFAVLDSVGVLGSLDADSVKSMLQPSGGLMNLSSLILYASNEASTTTTSASPQVRVTLTLPAGTYLLFGYFEAFNTNIDAGVRAWMYEGGTEIAWGIVYSNTSTYGSWSGMKQVAPSTQTDYTLDWSSWPNGTTSYIRRARLFAIKIQ